MGVDDLGRVLVAVDEQPIDGFVDRYFLFTAEYRLTQPWSQRLENARLVYESDSLSVRSTPPDFEVLLALSGSEPRHAGHPPHIEVFIERSGLELGIFDPDPFESVLLSSLAVEDLWTWPPAFWYDVLDPESGRCFPDSDCVTGGFGEHSCSYTVGNITCSVSCNSDYYACCQEHPLGGQPRCRCRLCIIGP